MAELAVFETAITSKELLEEETFARSPTKYVLLHLNICCYAQKNEKKKEARKTLYCDMGRSLQLVIGKHKAKNIVPSIQLEIRNCK